MAKAAYWTVTDVEARKRGEQTGLDTLVVLVKVSIEQRELFLKVRVRKCLTEYGCII